MLHRSINRVTIIPPLGPAFDGERQPQNIEVVAQGPFIAGSRDELAGYYAAYRHGRLPHAGTMRPVALA